DIRAGDSVRSFMDRFKAKKLATQVEIVLLAPLAMRVPPFVLGAFAQSGSQTADTIKRRLDVARAEVEQRGGLVVGWAADGASAHFKLMRLLRALPAPGTPIIEIALVPTLLSDETALHTLTAAGKAALSVWLPARRASF